MVSIEGSVRTDALTSSSETFSSASPCPAVPSILLKKVSTSKASCAISSLAALKDSSLEKSKAFQSMGPLSEGSSMAGARAGTRSKFFPIGKPDVDVLSY
jgi:hypothetical protein